MNLKRIFGALLTGLGIGGLIYAAIIYVSSSGGGQHDLRALVIYGLLGLLFFIAGISLIRTTKDES